MNNSKIGSIQEVSAAVADGKAKGRVIVHCHGVFDLLHIGHIKHLEAARKLGDLLVVTLTPDRYVNKGPHRPAFPERLRAEALASLSCVDYVAINEWATAVETIRALKPSIYVKGLVREQGKRDHTDAIQHEEEAVKAVGGRLVLTDEETFSASELINRHMGVFTPEVTKFLEQFRKRHPPEEIVKYLQALRKMKVLVMGETIIDEYEFCDVMGKAGKEPVLAARHKYTERYAGGILAIANHLANFCDDVALLSTLGAADTQEAFIRSHLNKNVRAQFVHVPAVPTIVKRRFLEDYLALKIFEVYVMSNTNMTPDVDATLHQKLSDLLREYDVVIVADFGHGLMTDSLRQLLCDKAKFLAVNTQTNAGNRGYNMISKYRRADFVSIGEPEVRMDCRDLDGDLVKMAQGVAERISCRRFMVTRGRSGCFCIDRDEGVVTVPAFSIRVVDRIGAGDAVLAITSPLVAQKVSSEATCFIANVVGAEACMIMGNKSSIEPASLFRHFTSLLK